MFPFTRVPILGLTHCHVSLLSRGRVSPEDGSLKLDVRFYFLGPQTSSAVTWLALPVKDLFARILVLCGVSEIVVGPKIQRLMPPFRPCLSHVSRPYWDWGVGFYWGIAPDNHRLQVAHDSPYVDYPYGNPLGARPAKEKEGLPSGGLRLFFCLLSHTWTL